MTGKPTTAAWREELRLRAAGIGGSAIINALLGTCRFEVIGEHGYRRYWESGRPVVFALWHGRLLAGAYSQRGNGLVALISQNRDGEYIARVVERWGFRTIRGSSSRGAGVALRGLVRAAKSGRSVVLTPDGPRGPRQKMKPGTLIVSQMSGAPVVPVATGADRAWILEGGWDRFQVPKPFSRVLVKYGEPIEVPRSATPEELSGLEAVVATQLDDLMRDVDEAGR